MLRMCFTLLVAMAFVLPASAGTALGQAESEASQAVFIENVGQFGPAPGFAVLGGRQSIWIGEDGLWISVYPGTVPGVNLKLAFSGANPHPSIQPVQPQAVQTAFFTGPDPNQWYTDVPVWAGLRYVELYPGIDLEIRGQEGSLKPILVARPGAQLGNVRIEIAGAEAVTLEGDWVRVITQVGDFSLPLLQVEGAAAEDEPVVESMLEGFTVQYPFAREPDQPDRRSLPPGILVYSTYLQAPSNAGSGIAVDRQGAVYVTGQAYGPSLPGASPFDPSGEGSVQAYVAKINPRGSALEYQAFLGGGGMEIGHSIAIDNSGAAYITGWTQSHDFPVTPGAFDSTCGLNGQCDFHKLDDERNSDGFVSKISPRGDSLLYSTYLGGNKLDQGHDIAIDRRGAAYITGHTNSTDFPTTSGAFDRNYGDASEYHPFVYDAYVVKLNPSGTALEYGTYLGGKDTDSGFAIGVDRQEAVYVTGSSYSASFPTTPGAYETRVKERYGDAFITKFAPGGARLVFSTALGGRDSDEGKALAIDKTGAVLVAGNTEGRGFPTTPGAFEPSQPGEGGSDGFVTRLSPDGTALLYSTFLGGSDTEDVTGIAVNGRGEAYVAGRTWSPDFPTSPGAFDTTLDGYSDGFVVKLNAAGSALAYGTLLGGSDQDGISALAHDRADLVCVTGITESPDFPTTPGAIKPGGSGGIFAARLWVK